MREAVGDLSHLLETEAVREGGHSKCSTHLWTKLGIGGGGGSLQIASQLPWPPLLTKQGKKLEAESGQLVRKSKIGPGPGRAQECRRGDRLTVSRQDSGLCGQPE